MAAVLNLCEWAILLENGRMTKSGSTDEVVNYYFMEGTESSGKINIQPDEGGITDDFRFSSVFVLKPGNGPTSQVSLIEGVDVQLEYEICSPIRGANVVVYLWDSRGTCILTTTDVDQNPSSIGEVHRPGRYVTRSHIPHQYLRAGRYYIGLSSSIPRVRSLADLPRVLAFDVVDTGSTESKIGQGRQGVVSPVLNWFTERVEDTGIC